MLALMEWYSYATLKYGDNIMTLDNLKVECPEDLPFENINSLKCEKECSAYNFLNKNCKINYHSIEAREKIINNIINEIKNGQVNLGKD